MKIAIIGEAWGRYEEAVRMPFVGPSGHELTKMLERAGINRAHCFLTNVFNFRPQPNNDIENLCQKERAGGFTSLKAGKYLRPEYFSHVYQLHKTLRDLKPNVAVLLGNTAAWAILGNSGIGKIRGTVTYSNVIPGLKCLPTYHPAAILRQWDLRPITILDLEKARRESEFPEIRRPHRTIYIEPSLADMEWYYDNFLRPARRITFDIETRGQQITCIGFAPDHMSALVIPFVDDRAATGSYWTSAHDEERAWNYVRDVLNCDKPKVAQNGLYDINFLWRSYGITVKNYEDDTMLLHHALQPESEKGLGFLGSIYTNEASWKMMRTRTKDIAVKKDK
jgi:uracil-DNA glycosylase